MFSGKRAVGVEYLQNGARRMAFAQREVILAAGAFNSPQLLQLSGIGPAELLRKLGIAVRADMPGIGADLQDHYNGRLVLESTKRFTLNDVVHNYIRGAREGLRYLLFRKGFLTMGASYAAGFVSTDPQTERPDVQIGLVLFSADKFGDGLHRFPGFTILVRLLRPQSQRHRAPEKRRSARAAGNQTHYLATEKDRNVLVEGMKAAQAIVDSSAMRR